MVFKKFADRIISAGATAANVLTLGPEQAEKIRQLESMGFPPERARHALNATDGDVDRAAELLLLGGDDAPNTNNASAAPVAAPRSDNNRLSVGTAVEAHNDEQMRRAIEESLFVNQQEEMRRARNAEAASTKRNKPGNNVNRMDVVDLTGDDGKIPVDAKKKNAASNAKQQPTKRNVKSAAANNAGKAAAARQNNNNANGRFLPSLKTTLNQTHPNVKVPAKLSHKSKEEQIMRCAHRLKSHVMAVDTLLRALTAVRNSPNNAKFRVIDRGNANYVKFVRDKPGAEDMLLAMNYRLLPSSDELRLDRELVDDALLYLGVSALEQMRTQPEYIEGKRLRAFHGEMRRVGKMNGSEMQSVGMTEAETAIRLEFLSRCPKEPPEGRGAWMYVILGDESEKIEGGKVQRRFDGDDTLEDVLNWLGGCYGSEVLDKIRDGSGGGDSAREWCLCDLNRYPLHPLDCEKEKGKTLQFLGLFPSSKLGVRLSDDDWRERKERDSAGGFDIHGSARGLGAASRSMLH